MIELKALPSKSVPWVIATRLTKNAKITVLLIGLFDSSISTKISVLSKNGHGRAPWQFSVADLPMVVNQVSVAPHGSHIWASQSASLEQPWKELRTSIILPCKTKNLSLFSFYLVFSPLISRHDIIINYDCLS